MFHLSSLLKEGHANIYANIYADINLKICSVPDQNLDLDEGTVLLKLAERAEG